MARDLILTKKFQFDNFFVIKYPIPSIFSLHTCDCLLLEEATPSHQQQIANGQLSVILQLIGWLYTQ